MQEKLMECFTNPIKCKLLLEIHAMGQITAKELAIKYNDIPIATLYRYLKRMTNDHILRVVQETPVRGTFERTYSLAIDLNAGMQNMLTTNDGDAYMRLFMQYILGFMKQFETYCKRENIDLLNDKSGFSLAPIYASDDELTAAIIAYSKIIQPLHQNTPADNRKLRTLGLIISPPENY